MSNPTEIPTDEHLIPVIFHHNLWANLRLFDACLALKEAQLNHSDPGTYGSIRATLVHLVRAEERYLFLLKGRDAAYAAKPDDSQTPLTDLQERVRQSGTALLDIATTAEPGLQVQVGEGEEAELIPAAAILLQAIHHAHEHRTQIETLLGQLAVEPPGLSGWRYHDEVMALSSA